MFNGLHEKTLLVRHEDDTFVHFEVDKVMLISGESVNDFYDIYEQYKDDYNVLIDSRLVYVILLSFIKYELELLIFDPYRNTVYNGLNFLSLITPINKVSLIIEEWKIFCAVKVFIDYFANDLAIKWDNENVAADILKTDTKNTKYQVCSAIIVGISNQNKLPVDDSVIMKFNKNIDLVLDGEDYTEDIEIPSLDMFYSIVLSAVQTQL